MEHLWTGGGMSESVFIELEQSVFDGCVRFIEAANFKNSVTDRDVHNNKEALINAKMAECAVARWTGVPLGRLHWNASSYDDGSDVPVAFWRLDVKHTKNGKCLIWPKRKRHLLEDKRFDALVLVRGELLNFEIV